MAFRELTEKELELLTDSQREIYEQKLEIHRERVRFVEQLEKMEQVEIPSFQPTLNPIALISGAPEINFMKTEHQVAQMPEVRTHIVQVDARPVGPVEKAEIPQVPTKVKVRTVKVDEQIAVAPMLPEYRPIQLVRREFQTAERVRVKVPATAAVQAPDASFCAPETTKAWVPAVRKTVPVDCPKIVLNENTAKPRFVSAPAAVHPKARIIQNEPPKITAPPEAMVVRLVNVAYVAPVVSAAVMNPVSVAVCPEKNYQKPQGGFVEAPAVVKTRVHKSSYHGPKINKMEAAAALMQVKVPERTIVQPVVPKMQFAHATAIHTPKINYEKQELGMVQLPQTDTVRVPDPQTNEMLHNLLKKANEK